MKLDLNCDLGEGEAWERTRSLLRWITSASLACGGHAGDLASMRQAVRLARRQGVRIGAHPGAPDRAEFGRATLQLSPDELEFLLLQQVGTLERVARLEGVRLHHVKLHGALYHASESDEALARGYVQAARRWWPQCLLYVKAGGRVERLARRLAVRAWGEIFADRAYQDDGTLVPRGRPGAVLHDPARARQRVELYQERGELETESGRRIAVRARTICVHSDTPSAPELARAVSLALARRRG